MNQPIHSAMYRMTYNTGAGSTFTTVVNFASHSEADLELQVTGHCRKYGAVGMDLLEPSDLEFEDLADD